MADAHEPMTAASPARATPRETASYIAELTAELADLARTARLDFLAYLLEVAKLEAATAAQGPAPGRHKA